MKRTGQFTIYKAKGAAQFSLIAPKFNDKGFFDKEGAVLVQAAPGDGNKDNPSWDWNKKITFAISPTDIASLLDQTKEAPRIFHEHQSTPKTFELIPGKGNFEGTFMLQIAAGKGTERNVITVPLTNGEYQVIMRLLVAALPTLIGWE